MFDQLTSFVGQNGGEVARRSRTPRLAARSAVPAETLQLRASACRSVSTKSLGMEHRKGGPAPTSDGVEMLEEGRDRQESGISWIAAAGGRRQQTQAAGLIAVVAFVFFSKFGAGVARPPA